MPLRSINFFGNLTAVLAGLLCFSLVGGNEAAGAPGQTAVPVKAKSSPVKPGAAKKVKLLKSSGKPYTPPEPRINDGISERLMGRSVSTLSIDGLKRIEKDAVTEKLTTKVGTVLSREAIKADIQVIFGMGFFDEVEVFAQASTEGHVDLKFKLKERPVVSKIEFDGNERVSSSDLKDVVKVKEWSILDLNRVKDDVALIQKHYEDKGFFLAKVTFSFKKVKEDEVELTYRINDYEKVQIKKVTFLNNTRFSDVQLQGVFRETKEGSFWSFLSSGGNFKEASFKEDLKRLTYWYLDHGYVKFRYENPIVTVSDDKRWLYISIYVEEGEQYSMGSYDFSGDLLFSKEDLRSEITLKEGEAFSISKRNTDIQKLTEKFQDLGYAFVNVVPKMDIHDDTKIVDVNYDFEKGNLVHFGEINVLGNSKTHDKVIRRELKIHEGELFSGSKLRISKENVERLGYFAPGEVAFNTVTPKGKPDILNVEIQVKERSTGTITLGAGYGSLSGFFLTTTVSEINLFGRGQSISLAGQYSTDSTSQSFNLGFTEPYTADTLWSSGFDFYYVTYPIPRKYQMRKLGADMRFGHPLFEYTNAYITYKNEGLRLTNPVDSSLQDQIELDEGVLSSIVWSVIRDRRNNRFETSDGNYQSVSLETAGVGGDKKFIKWTLNNRYYKSLIGDLVLRNNFETGAMASLWDRALPPSEKFYLGGPNNLKGYYPFLVGPSRSGPIGDVPLGGAVEAFTTVELEYPIVKEAGLKWVMFGDVGNAWDDYPRPSQYMVVRADWGFGIRWFSPIGPLRFEWGFPIARKPTESSTVFNFFIGPPF